MKEDVLLQNRKYLKINFFNYELYYDSKMSVIKDEIQKRIIFFDEPENEIHSILKMTEKNNLFIKNGWNVNYEIQNNKMWLHLNSNARSLSLLDSEE